MDTDDTAIKKVNSMINRVRELRLPVYIHKNIMDGEKDFGVPINRISESILRVL